jgi:beta-galactosidase/beta-glucuronidase
MCFDGPTFFCTEGWDWIPGIRDRCTGIWQDVVLHVSGPVTVGDVQVKTVLPLPDTSRADVSVTALVENQSAMQQSVLVRGAFEGVSVEKVVALAPGENGQVRFDSGDFQQLVVQHPRLWWPNGYGKPELYHLRISVLDTNRQVLDSRSLRFGIREITYELSALDSNGELKRYEFSPSAVSDTEVIDHRHRAIRQISGEEWVPTLASGAEKSPALKSCSDNDTAPFLVIKVNGRRVVCKGGNWGLDEALKRSGRERLEHFIRMERDAHLTLVRNWCGQSTEEAFYDLCDEYGLMVWNDFWLSSQDWNQQPGDLNLWLLNAEDVVKRFRNHPSIILWCGRNEGVRGFRPRL